MPNWCDCDLTVVGPPKDLHAFKTRAASDPEHAALRAKLEGSQGPEEQTAAIFKSLGPDSKEVLNHDVFVPMPDEIKNKPDKCSSDKPDKNLIKKYGCDNGYDWNCRYLGSKWGICHSEFVAAGPRHLKYRFDSPWSPPTQVIVAMSAQHPTLTFKLHGYEMGMAYQVHMVMKAGTIIKDDEKEYSGHRGG